MSCKKKSIVHANTYHFFEVGRNIFLFKCFSSQQYLSQVESMKIYHLLYGNIYHVPNFGTNKFLVQSFSLKQYLSQVKNVKISCTLWQYPLSSSRNKSLVCYIICTPYTDTLITAHIWKLPSCYKPSYNALNTQNTQNFIKKHISYKSFECSQESLFLYTLKADSSTSSLLNVTYGLIPHVMLFSCTFCP